MPKPTEIALLPPDPDADEPLPISRAQLLPAFVVPVLNNRSPDSPTVPALLVNTATLPELVAVPTPNEIVMNLPEAILPLPPLIVATPPLVLPSPKARVKLMLLLVNDHPEMMDASPPAAPDKSAAIILNAPPMLVLEPTEVALLPTDPDADEPLPISKARLLPALAVPVLNDRLPNMPAVPALLVNTATLLVPTLDEIVKDPPEAVLPSPPLIVTTHPLVLPFPEARVKLPPLLVDNDPEMMDPSPPTAPDLAGFGKKGGVIAVALVLP